MVNVIEKPEWAAVGKTVLMRRAGYGSNPSFKEVEVTRHTATRIVVKDGEISRSFGMRAMGTWCQIGTSNGYVTNRLVNPSAPEVIHARKISARRALQIKIASFKIDLASIDITPEATRERGQYLLDLADQLQELMS